MKKREVACLRQAVHATNSIFVFSLSSHLTYSGTMNSLNTSQEGIDRSGSSKLPPEQPTILRDGLAAVRRLVGSALIIITGYWEGFPLEHVSLPWSGLVRSASASVSTGVTVAPADALKIASIRTSTAVPHCAHAGAARLAVRSN